jgi:hypothetical protein
LVLKTATSFPFVMRRGETAPGAGADVAGRQGPSADPAAQTGSRLASAGATGLQSNPRLRSD